MIDVRQRLDLPSGMSRTYYSLPMLEKTGIARLSRLPVTIRILLESVLRHVDGLRIRNEDVEALAGWRPDAPRTAEVPFVVGRVLLQDFTGVPLLVDLAAMRSAVAARGSDLGACSRACRSIWSSITRSRWTTSAGADALRLNMEMEFRRNDARYRFLKWGAQAFDGLRIVPPGFGICHQVNLEFLASVVLERDGVLYPDTLVGTDSHTTMINGLGVLGWGVGGIEAEAAMLGQPVYLLLPDVVGVHLHGELREGVTATDLVLRITELLRAGAAWSASSWSSTATGAASLSVPDRATLANMAPEYGATVGFFPVDEQSLPILLATGRSDEQVEIVRRYYQAQELFGVPVRDQCDYTSVLDLDFASVEPCVAGPKRPQDRIPLGELGHGSSICSRLPTAMASLRRNSAPPRSVRSQTATPPRPGGGDQSDETSPTGRRRIPARSPRAEMMNNRPDAEPHRRGRKRAGRTAVVEVGHGQVVIAAITSCTNTSNPAVMLAAGLLAKKAVERGLRRSAVGEDLAGAGLARGERVPGEDGPAAVS